MSNKKAVVQQEPEAQPQGETKPDGVTETASQSAALVIEPQTESANTNEQTEGANIAPVESERIDDTAPYGYKKDGTPAAKRGRKPATEVEAGERDKQRARLRSVTASTPRSKPELGSATVTPLAVVNYQALGEQTADLWFNGGRVVFGEDWAPDDKGEALAVAGAFAGYFKATNMRDLPPGVALCFVLSVYTLKHAQRPTVKTRLESIGAWFKSKMPKRRMIGG